MKLYKHLIITASSCSPDKHKQTVPIGGKGWAGTSTSTGNISTSYTTQ